MKIARAEINDPESTIGTTKMNSFKSVKGVITTRLKKSAEIKTKKEESEISYRWRQGRLKRLEDELLLAKAVEDLKREQEQEALESRIKKAEAMAERLRILNHEKEQELRENDLNRLDQMRKEKERLLRFERFGIENEIRRNCAAKRKAEEEAERMRIQKLQEHARNVEFQEHSEREEAERLASDDAYILSMMRKMGIVPANKPKSAAAVEEIKRTRKLKGSNRERLVVRYAEKNDQDQDAEYQILNLRAIQQYMKTFPTATDHYQKFPHFFMNSTTSIKGDGKNLGETGAYVLGKLLVNGCGEKSTNIDLGYCNIKHRGLYSICRALSRKKRLTHLQVLVLSGNQLSDDSMETLGKALQSRSEPADFHLHRLDLSCNFIQDCGAKALGHSIFKACPFLDSINLHTNFIGHAGAKAILTVAATREENSSLSSIKCICLQNNRITPKAMRELSASTRFDRFMRL